MIIVVVGAAIPRELVVLGRESPAFHVGTLSPHEKSYAVYSTHYCKIRANDFRLSMSNRWCYEMMYSTNFTHSSIMISKTHCIFRIVHEK